MFFSMNEQVGKEREKYVYIPKKHFLLHCAFAFVYPGVLLIFVAVETRDLHPTSQTLLLWPRICPLYCIVSIFYNLCFVCTRVLDVSLLNFNKNCYTLYVSALLRCYGCCGASVLISVPLVSLVSSHCVCVLFLCLHLSDLPVYEYVLACLSLHPILHALFCTPPPVRN